MVRQHVGEYRVAVEMDVGGPLSVRERGVHSFIADTNDQAHAGLCRADICEVGAT